MSNGRLHIEASDDEDEFADIPVAKPQKQQLSWYQQMMLQDGGIGESPRLPRNVNSGGVSKDSVEAPVPPSTLTSSQTNGTTSIVGKVTSLSDAFARKAAAATNDASKSAASSYPARSYAPSYDADSQRKRLHSNWADGNRTAPSSKAFKSRSAPRTRSFIVDELPSEEEDLADEEETDEGEVEEGDSSDEDDGARDDGSDNEYNNNEDIDKRAMAEKIMKQCEKTVQNLRQALSSWAGSTQDDVNAGGNTCIDLLDIKDKGSMMPVKESAQSNDTISSDILSSEDIKTICPTLELKPYQLLGVNWMKLLHLNGVNGVLADDMGLGKTVQTISFLGWLKFNSKIKKPHLIVLPNTLLDNWKNEIERFCPSLNFILYTGNQDERSVIREQLEDLVAKEELDIVITTYSRFETKSEDLNFLKNKKWHYLVLDEAHQIKNSKTQR